MRRGLKAGSPEAELASHAGMAWPHQGVASIALSSPAGGSVGLDRVPQSRPPAMRWTSARPADTAIATIKISSFP